MGGVEGGKLGRGGEAPGRICNIIPPDSLCQPYSVDPEGLEFFQRRTPSVGALFAPLEEALIEDFIPALLGVNREEVTGSLFRRITWGVNRARIGIPDPTNTSPDNFETSYHCC